MVKRCELNLRDLGGIDDIIPKGQFLRSGKLSILASIECAELCSVTEYPDPIVTRPFVNTELSCQPHQEKDTDF